MAINPTLQQFLETLRTDAAPDPGLTDAMLELYPFFTLPAAMELKRSRETMTEERRARLSACVALNAPDSKSLMRLIDPDGDRLASLYPQEETDNTPSTDDAIATFLDTYGKIDEREQALLERLIFNPVPDYSSVLARQEAAEAASGAPAESEQDRRLDSFLETHRPAQAPAPAPEAAPSKPREHHTPKAPADSTLSESLSKIYIKQRRFDKAYEIISQLSLKNPEKSIYFADQLRFLQKLILNSKYNNK